MTRRSASAFSVLNPRLLGFTLCFVGSLLTMLSFAATPPVLKRSAAYRRIAGASPAAVVASFTFVNSLNNVGGAMLASGIGSVTSATIGSDPHQYIVDLTGVTNAQSITVSLANVQDIAGNVSSNISRQMGVLIGDTTADTFVNSGDIAQTKSQSGTVVGASNFRVDVTVDGNLNSGDIGLVKSKSGTALP